MKTHMNDTQLETIEQIEAFLSGTQTMELIIEGKAERYLWIQRALIRLNYLQLSKAKKGVVMRYLGKMSCYSPAQVKRLIKQYREKGRLERKQRTVKSFSQKYTVQDKLLLAALDERHGTLSGPATKKLCERAYTIFGECEYERLATVSISHLYNLRQSTTYMRQRRQFNKTRPVTCLIGERRKPNPQGQPGFIRIDSVHQGDQDGMKGVYHINAVDEITQFEIVASVEKISERYLIPVLEQMLEAFPFVIQSFHSDNGSEYINKQVAKLLNKLLIEFTKSRARQSNDNALAESKNAAVVRKHFGYSHIPQKWAPLINQFNQDYLNPYINYHRPCFFPMTVVDAKGKHKKTYPYSQMMTPYDKLKSLPDAAQYLKPQMSFEQLDNTAYAMSDNQAAEQLREVKRELFRTIFENPPKAA
ncbi:MAG: transposase family protein [Planctomycetes bacterium]|nr:transposase family protein [Planctomycetota bacterium]